MTTTAASTETSTIDPVCGMKVDPAKAAGTEEYHGKNYYFCGKGCAAKFHADPEKYLMPKPTAPAPPAPRDPATEYVCPMDPEVRQTVPGACPKCGMALEPASLAAPCNAHGVHLPHAS